MYFIVFTDPSIIMDFRFSWQCVLFPEIWNTCEVWCIHEGKNCPDISEFFFIYKFYLSWIKTEIFVPLFLIHHRVQFQFFYIKVYLLLSKFICCWTSISCGKMSLDPLTSPDSGTCRHGGSINNISKICYGSMKTYPK